MKNKKLIIILGVIVVIFIIMLIIRHHNLSNKATSEDTETTDTSTEVVEDTQTGITEATTEAPQDSYKQSLGIGNGDDTTITIERDPTTEATTEYVQTEPTYETVVNNFTHTEVPDKMVDGSSCKNYLASVKLSDFGSFWGSALTDEDFVGHKKYLVGVEQDGETVEKGDLQSVGWLLDNLEAEKFQSNDAIKFTNLHIIGSLADDHLAVLCCYDWYSAFGLKDTLVVFEDISNTLKVSDFNAGDVFSATVFVHNIKTTTVKGYRVVCVEYTPFGATDTQDTTQDSTSVEMNEDAKSKIKN
jgi:uncharacterized protein YxeA